MKNIVEIIPHEQVEKNWNYYSKSWHKRFGPKLTFTRTATVRFDDGTTVEVTVSSWHKTWKKSAAIAAKAKLMK